MTTQLRTVLRACALTPVLMLAACAAKPVVPGPFIGEFWKNMGWQRYEALPKLVVPEEHKHLKSWIGPKREPGIRVLESSVDQLEMASETTAVVTIFMKYYIEPEYTEMTTEVTQTWNKLGGVWVLKEGYPITEDPVGPRKKP